MKSWQMCIVAAGVLVASSVPGLAQTLPAFTTELGTFAIVDTSGVKLLPNASLASPQLLTTALCPGIRRLAIQFERSGFVGPNALLDPGTKCFLATDQMITGSELLALVKPDADVSCGRPRVQAYEEARERPIVGCWVVARAGSDERFAALEFARRLRYALASVVVDTGKRLLFADFHGDFWAPGFDVWHAGDGGVVTAKDIEIVFALRRGDTYTVGISWSADDGVSLGLWQSGAGNDLKQVLEDWYPPAPSSKSP